jgi:hypothetical protein
MKKPLHSHSTIASKYPCKENIRVSFETSSPTVLSYTSTKEKSKIPSHFSLGYVAPFVANLREKAAATCVPTEMDPSGPTLSLNVEGTPINNVNDVERCPYSMRLLKRAKRSKED